MTRTAYGTFVQWFVHLLILVLLASTPVPGVNESHYLPKAKHAWDSSYAPHDLFLESHDSHLLSTWFAGSLTTFLPLDAVAWTGRLLAWSLFAWGWLRLTRSLGIASWLSPVALAAWYLATTHWHWAGEWAVGGFEGKAIAYPLVLVGISEAVQGRWRTTWLWLGGAMAWHPLVGGWAGLSLGLVWLGSRERRTWKQQLPWLAGGALLGLIGVGPALAGIGGPAQAGQVVASQVHVYLRLAHHLCPLAFPPERHWAAVATFVAFLVVSSLVWVFTSLKSKRTVAEADQADKQAVLPLTILLRTAWWSVVFAIVGLLIDLLMSDPERSTYQPVIASKLLRFYWFRWADIAVPLAWTCGLAWMATRLCQESPQRNPELHWTGKLLAGVFCGLVFLIGGRSVSSTWNAPLPPADKILLSSVGPDNSITAEQRYIDWLAVCAWIRENTPRDSLWLTPKYQQTFKWYAERAEVVCWKDVPQDNASVVEWYRRISELEPPRSLSATGKSQIRGWTTEEIIQLSEAFHFDWVLVDRSLYGANQPPPLLEITYPTGGIPNQSFAVFRVTR